MDVIILTALLRTILTVILQHGILEKLINNLCFLINLYQLKYFNVTLLPLFIYTNNLTNKVSQFFNKISFQSKIACWTLRLKSFDLVKPALDQNVKLNLQQIVFSWCMKCQSFPSPAHNSPCTPQPAQCNSPTVNLCLFRYLKLLHSAI